MSGLIQHIIDKYHGVASAKVVHAVAQASARTGADFSFLMEKASAESNFNTSAKSKSSSATGLFQFIESTWLNMVKEHGAKYGLGKLADQIEIKNGKPCVENCAVKNAILNLRKNPEIAALMAGELSAGNKEYLEAHTKGPVGTTELYLAHFMGAGGAAKFIENRQANGNAIAAHLFPKEAHANKAVFFNPDTGKARTLNQIYASFAQKFNGGHAVKTTAPVIAEPVVLPAPPAPASIIPPTPPSMVVAQALPSLYMNIIWNDTADEARSGFAATPKPALSAENILILAQMQHHKPHYNA
jgi:hypothetical protein